MKRSFLFAGLMVALLGMFVACQNSFDSGTAAAAVSTDSARALDTTGWTLAWSDEFTGTAVDTTKWNFETGNGSGGWGNAELEYYQAANATVANGYLTITAKKESVGGYSFTSARMQTKGKVTAKYGKIVARIKNPEGMGMWPAFWLLGTNIDSVGWPACGEIDVMEMAGGTNDYKTLSTCHWSNAGSYANYGLSYTNSAKLSAGYHDYEVEWDSSYIRARFDGAQYYVIDITPAELSEFQNSFFLLLNLAVGGNFFGGTASNVSQITTAMPQTMMVDYVRIYTKTGSTATPTPTPTPTATATPTPTPSSTFTQTVAYSGTTGTISFKPGWTSQYVDVHYKLNAGSQLNYRMTYNSTTAAWEQKITSLASGTKVDYFFTYEKSGLAYDTAWYSYTASGTATPTPTPTPTATPAVTAVPGVVTTNVGAIANGSSVSWTVAPASSGNYRVKITSTGTTANFAITLSFNGQTIPLSIGKGSTVNCDFANVATGNKTLSIKATTANVSIGKLELVKY